MAFLSPALQPWYLLWGLVVLVCAPRCSVVQWPVWVSTALLALALPAGPRFDEALLANDPLVVLAAAVALVPLTFRPSWSTPPRRRRSRPLEPGLVSIVVPTRNEAENIVELIDRIRSTLSTQPHEIAVVIDGDLQHPPESIGELVGAVDAGADIAIGARRREGHEDGGLSRFRYLASMGLTRFVRIVFPHRFAGVSDPLSGFFAFRVEAVDIEDLAPNGFKILVEILATHRLRTVDVEIEFRDRLAGRSRAGVAEASRLVTHDALLRVRTWAPWRGWTPSLTDARSVA